MSEHPTFKPGEWVEAKTLAAGGFTTTATTGTGYVDPRGLYGSGSLPGPRGWVRTTPSVSPLLGATLPTEQHYESASALYRAMYKEVELSVRKGEPVEEQGRIYAGYFMRIHAAILAEQALANIKQEAEDLTSKAEAELEAMKYEETAAIRASAFTSSMEELKTRVALETFKKQLEDAEKLSSKPSGFISRNLKALYDTKKS